MNLLHVHVGPDGGGGLSTRGGDGRARGEDVPGIDGRHGDGGRPDVVHGRAGQQGRLANDLDDARRRGNKRLHEVGEVVPDLLAPAAEELAGAVLLEALEGLNRRAVDVLVDGLNVIVVQLLALLLLAGPVGGVCLGVDAVNLLVELDQGVNGVGGELVGDLVSQDHVDVDNVGLDVDELVGKEVLRVVSGHVGLGELGEHDGGEGPDGVLVGEGLGEASLVLGDGVEGALDTVDALEGCGEPGLDLGTENDVDGGGSGRESGGGGW